LTIRARISTTSLTARQYSREKHEETQNRNMIPSPEDCSKESCRDAEQQFARVLRRWAALPYGEFNERESNHQSLRIAIEYQMFQRVLERSSDSTMHEYWSDGVEFVESKVLDCSYYFGGSCIFSDRHAQTMWLAPFELRIEYDPNDLDCPSSVDLRLGQRDPVDCISKRFKAGREYRLYALAHSLYGSRPQQVEDWAAHVYLNPYRPQA
jgi:hypothetical protein